MPLTVDDSVRKEWNNAAEAWVDFVRTGKDYTRIGLNNPAAFDLIGNVKGEVVLDLACGEGFNTRILARMGARVTGVDFSEKLIKFARQKEANEKLNIYYEVMDATNLETIPDGHFDPVTCFMALQDIENYELAISEVARILKNKGRFVFSIPHPCFEKISLRGKRVPAASNYFETVEYHIDWDMERLEKPFMTTSFHRTLSEYFQSLYLSKLYVRRLVEPRLSRESLEKYPYLQDALIRPQSVIIESIKDNDGE